jgi:hypothetical protein
VFHRAGRAFVWTWTGDFRPERPICELHRAEPDPTDTAHKFFRAHGKMAEYAPFLAVMIVYLGAWMVWTMFAVTVLRFQFVVGTVQPAPISPAQPSAWPCSWSERGGQRKK